MDVARCPMAPVVDDFDHQARSYAQDPFPVLERAFELSPITWTDAHGGYYVVTGYEEVRWIWSNWEVFSGRPSVSIPPGLGSERPLMPVEIDPPDHAKYRSLLNPVFSPRRMRELEPKIRTSADRLIDAFVDRGSCDLIGEFAHILPTEIFVQMLGVPLEEGEQWRQWNHDVLHSYAEGSGTERPKLAGQAAMGRLYELLELRKAERADDIISVLIDARHEGEGLTDDEIVDMSYGLFLAGLDTVQAALGVHYAFLSQHSGHRDQLVADPSLIPTAVEELLRWDSLVSAARTVTRDVEHAGVEFKKGDRVLMVNRAADRDPRVWDNPAEVDFTRPSRGTLVFGAGPHRCVGSHLARLELQIAHERIHARIPDYRLAPGARLEWHTGTVAGLSEVPLVWG